MVSTSRGIGWAFTHVHAGNWHPLTTISHMLDCQIYGLEPWGHHLTNVLLRCGGHLPLSGAVTVNWCPLAECFCGDGVCHSPAAGGIGRVGSGTEGHAQWCILYADSVGLCTLYVRSNRPTSGRYMAVIILYALGIMSKPTLVTLPFVLLLLDYWPLRRLPSSRQGPSLRAQRATTMNAVGIRPGANNFREDPFSISLSKKFPFLSSLPSRALLRFRPRE